MHSALLTLGHIVCLFAAIAAEQSDSRIAFAKFATPSGNEKFDSTKLIVSTPVKGFVPHIPNVELISATDSSRKVTTRPTVTTAKIVFTKGAVAAGWKKYQGKLPSTVKFATTKDARIPLEYRSAVFKWSGFTYTHTTAPGKYRVILGFAEFQKCGNGQRVFKVQLNNKSAGPIDVHKRVRCFKSYTLSVGGVIVKPDGKLSIKLTRNPNSKTAPFLANIQILKVTGGGNGGSAVSQPATPTPSTKPPAAKSKPVRYIDAGGPSDVASVKGVSQVYPNVFQIEGTDDNAKFSRHRFGKDFTYVLNVTPNIVYDITLFFAESFIPGCKVGFRVFDAVVYDGGKDPGTGKAVRGLDIFQLAGCRTAYSRTIAQVRVGSSGQLAIQLKSSVENAMVSALQVTTDDKNYRDTPSTPPPANGGPKLNSVLIDVGGTTDTPVPGTTKSVTTKSVKPTFHASANVLRTSRYGADFKYSFDLKPGAYDVILSFSENFDPKFCAEEGNRVFNVYVNDKIQLEAFDIFAEAGGCRKGVDVKLSETVGAVDTKPMVIRFSSVSNFAQVNQIKIKPAAKTCVPESTTGKITADHAAHSVPGTYPPQSSATSPKFYVDNDGDGFVTVQINGRQSHTHFFDASNNIVGRITDYTWRLAETNEIISKAVAFSYKFPLGTTRLTLAVTDNTCDSHEAETSVTVTGTIQPGQYCYYYAGLTKTPHVGKKGLREFPSFAAVSSSVSLGSSVGFPSFSFDSTKFAVRCSFFLQVDKASEKSKISVSTGGSGIAKVYKGGDRIIDTESSSKAMTALPVGMIGFEIVYLRTSLSKKPVLSFFVNDTVPAPVKIKHDRTTVRPILTKLSPNSGGVGGGGQVKITGYGLYNPLTVKFGDKSVPVLPFGRSPTQLFVRAPAVSNAKTVKITITSDAKIESNSLSYAYGSTCDPVSFSQTAITKADGSTVDDLGLTTSVAIGQDGRLYIGTLGGSVQVVGYDVETLTVESRCYSKPIRDPRFKKNGFPAFRDILGIAFNPKDKDICPYVTTSTMFWESKNRIDNALKERWMNGAVDKLKEGVDPSDPGVCLVYDKRIVTNIPVSNHDHSVNALEFTQKGDLLISVGGFTNLGLPGYKLGNYWETHMSAAILVARLSKPGYNGKIEYTNPDTPRLARKKSGDVDLYVTGLRNCFGMTMTRSAEVYTTDNGPNCGFGNTATSCSNYNEEDAKKWDTTAEVDWPGTVKLGWQSCPYSISRPDKILHITEGSWYGHPNLARGGAECAWINPFTDKTGTGKNPPSKYKPAMATVQSPTTAIREYTANHFCGKLRGELVLSTFKDGNTYRLRANKEKVESGPDQIVDHGGLSFVQNAQGDLIFPRLNSKDIFVLRPKISSSAALFIAGAAPFRHCKAGGTRIIIAGSNFGAMPKVKIGTGTCAVIRSTETEITCTVPPNNGANLKPISVQTESGETAILPDAVLYMDA